MVFTNSFVGVLPPTYRGAIMAGHGAAGVAVAAIKFCLNFWWFPSTDLDSITASAILFFGIAAVLMIICGILTYVLTNHSFFKYYQTAIVPAENTIRPDKEPLLNDVLVLKSNWQLMRDIWVDWVNAALSLFITLTLFPGFTTMIRNYDKSLSNENFRTILINVFQVCDFIGRFVPKWILFPSMKYLWIPVWSRLIYIPLILIPVYSDLFPSNYVAYTVIVLFSLSNGYWTTLAVIYGPMRVDRKHVESASILMGYALQVGVFMGVHLAMILLLIIEGEKAVIG